MVGLSKRKEPDPWSQVPPILDPAVPGDQPELHRLFKVHKETGSEELEEDIVSKRCRVITLGS